MVLAELLIHTFAFTQSALVLLPLFAAVLAHFTGTRMNFVSRDLVVFHSASGVLCAVFGFFDSIFLVIYANFQLYPFGIFVLIVTVSTSFVHFFFLSIAFDSGRHAATLVSIVYTSACVVYCLSATHAMQMHWAGGKVSEVVLFIFDMTLMVQLFHASMGTALHFFIVPAAGLGRSAAADERLITNAVTGNVEARFGRSPPL